MGIVRHLQHWLGGSGPDLLVNDFVPDDHYLRQWADTFPWDAMAAAVDRHVATHFPKETRRGRPPGSTRVLLALELLQAELACSDEPICSRLCTDLAVRFAFGLQSVQANRHQSDFLLPVG